MSDLKGSTNMLTDKVKIGRYMPGPVRNPFVLHQVNCRIIIAPQDGQAVGQTDRQTVKQLTGPQKL